MMVHGAPRRRALTLVEVVITIAIVALSAIAILGTLSAGAYQQQSIRERNGAMRAAGDVMETTKNRLFRTLQAGDIDVVIDDRGTANPGDDVRGVARLRLFDANGNEVGIPGSPVPTDRSMLRVEVEVEWTPAGRRVAGPRSVTLASLLAP